MLGEITDHSGGGVQEDARLGLINDSVVVCSSLLVFALGDGLPKQQLFSPEKLLCELSLWWGLFLCVARLHNAGFWTSLWSGSGLTG